MSDHVELKSLVDTHDRPFVVIGENYQVVAVNKAYEKAFSITAGEIIGQRCHKILHHRDRPCNEVGEECPYVQCYVTQQSCSCLHTHHDPEGGSHWVRINMYPIKCADGRTYVGEMLHEIAAHDLVFAESQTDNQRGHDELDNQFDDELLEQLSTSLGNPKISW